MWKYLLIIGLLVISTHQAIAQVFGDCATPNYQPGKCIPLTECTQIYTRLQTAGYTLTDHEINYFKRSQCGNFEGKTLICCTESMRRITTTTTTNRPKTSRRISSELPQPPFCGSFLVDLTIGGERTSLFEYPWLALLYFRNTTSNEVEHLCGGSLINDRYVLTAAHCVWGLDKGTLRLESVRLGEWDTQTNPDCVEYRNQKKNCADPHVDMTVAQIIVHPNYESNSRSYHNDIALLRLSLKVTYTKSIQPICLPFTPELQTNDFSNRIVDVVGWGRTETQSSSRYKLKGTLEIADFSNCTRSYRRRYIDLERSQICASGSGKVDACHGDSGGPLILEETVNGGNYFFQVGIVSIGLDCGSRYLAEYPGIYTRVGEFMDWIKQNIY